MAAATSTIHVSGLGKGKLVALRKHARGLGLSAEQYARQLIEEGLRLEHEARTTTFDGLLAPVRAGFRKSGMSEAELDKLVDAARARRHNHTTKKKSPRG